MEGATLRISGHLLMGSYKQRLHPCHMSLYNWPCTIWSILILSGRHKETSMFYLIIITVTHAWIALQLINISLCYLSWLNLEVVMDNSSQMLQMRRPRLRKCVNIPTPQSYRGVEHWLEPQESESEFKASPTSSLHPSKRTAKVGVLSSNELHQDCPLRLLSLSSALTLLLDWTILVFILLLGKCELV